MPSNVIETTPASGLLSAPRLVTAVLADQVPFVTFIRPPRESSQVART